MVDQYKPNGIPVTDHERELLIILIEECAEVSKECNDVIHVATKLLRFGKENRPDGDATPNTKALALEVGDLNHMINRILAADIIKISDVKTGENRKAQRLKQYLQTKP